MKTIESLTPEQEALIPVYVEKYLKLGLLTEPANRFAAEEAIGRTYRTINLDKPVIMWASSPIIANAMIYALKSIKSLTPRDQLRVQLAGQLWDQLWGQLGDQLSDQLWDQLAGQLWDQLWGQLWGQLWDQLRVQLSDQLWDQLWGQLRGQLWGQLWDQLSDQLWDQLWDQLRSQLKDQKINLQYTCYGGQDLHWLAFYEFINSELGCEYTGQDYHPILDIACNAGWWYPYSGICIVCERPSIIKRQNNRLHCADGPAISYADGLLDIYSWRGVRIPEEWIMNKGKTDPSLALTWENLEQRRCLAEIIGWEKIINKLNPVVIDEDADPMVGTLLEVDIPDSGRERFLKVLCGTGRTFVICVPPDTQTAIQAQATLWQTTEDEYRQLEVRT